MIGTKFLIPVAIPAAALSKLVVDLRNAQSDPANSINETGTWE